MTPKEPAKKLRKIENSTDFKFKVYPILSSSLTTEDVPSTSYKALHLDNKKVIGQIIGRLKELPEELQHLKRVGKDGSVLIAKSREEAERIVGELAHEEVRAENLKTVTVPATKPATRRQFDVAKNLWPTGFHPDHDVERLLDGSFLNATLKEHIATWLGSLRDSEAVAVQSSTLLASGSATRHPLGHPVMEMVGSLKRSGGEEYLGTGCDVFLASEPCAMCAMALVHFRVKRVFYVRESRNGVLKEGGWQLHLEPAINHHYEVFRVEMEHSGGGLCTNLLSKC